MVEANHYDHAARNRAVTRLLDKQHDERSAIRPIEFFFYGQQDALENLASVLTQNGFSILSLRSDALMVDIQADAEDMTIDRLSVFAADAASRFGVEYDGWGMPMVGATGFKPSLLQKLKCWLKVR